MHTSTLKPFINIFQTYNIFTGLLIHQTTNYNFYLYLMENSPGQCFQTFDDGCAKAYMRPNDFRTAYDNFYN